MNDRPLRCFAFLLFTSGCDTSGASADTEATPSVEPPSPEPTPTSSIESPDEPQVELEVVHEVNVASIPTGASVLLDGALLGRTPYPLRFKHEISVDVTLAGHRTQTVTVGPRSELNLVVKLEALDGKTPAVVPVAPTVASPAATTPEPRSEPRARARAPATGAEAEAESASSLPYPDVAAAKRSYRAGRITRSQYDDAIRKLKIRRSHKIEAIQALYRGGRITKEEYARRKRIIDNEYKGV